MKEVRTLNMTGNMKEAKPAMNRKSIFLRACRGGPVEHVPVWMMRQAGRYLPEYRAVRARHSFLEVCKTPALAVEVSLQPFLELAVDAVIVFSDILIPVEAMGLAVEFFDSGPALPHPIRTYEDVKALRDFDPGKDTKFVGDTIAQLCRELGPEVPVLGFAAAPWTLACYMIDGRAKSGFGAVKRMLYCEPELMRELLSRIARNTARYLQAQIAAGAAAVQLFDTWAGELSEADYDEFALPSIQLLLDELHAGETPVIYYSKGTSHLLGSISRLGADVLSVDWRVDLADARAVCRKRSGPPFAVQGNIDPSLLLGPIEGIHRAVQEAIAKTGGVGHILNLGHGILPETPVDHARAFIEAGQTAELPVAPGAAGRR
jgi:uroporphyrinogen decarboxylase